MTAPVATTLKLDPDTRARVQKLAEARRRSPHWLLREAVAQYIEREEAQEQMRADAMAAWREYQTTGQHVTGAEADSWLARLEAGEDAAPPTCHG
jgi:predicted transcriptional regulator